MGPANLHGSMRYWKILSFLVQHTVFGFERVLYTTVLTEFVLDLIDWSFFILFQTYGQAKTNSFQKTHKFLYMTW